MYHKELTIIYFIKYKINQSKRQASKQTNKNHLPCIFLYWVEQCPSTPQKFMSTRNSEGDLIWKKALCRHN